jgi:hypothetical protein
MSTRSNGLQWLKIHYGKVAGPLYTSKFYEPEHSWTKSSVWWFQIPVRHIRDNKEGYIHLLGQLPGFGHAFHYLKVPTAYLREQFAQLGFTNEDMINLHLSAEPGNMFVDQRGPGNIRFHQFLVKD